MILSIPGILSLRQGTWIRAEIVDFLIHKSLSTMPTLPQLPWISACRIIQLYSQSVSLFLARPHSEKVCLGQPTLRDIRDEFFPWLSTVSAFVAMINVSNCHWICVKVHANGHVDIYSPLELYSSWNAAKKLGFFLKSFHHLRTQLGRKDSTFDYVLARSNSN